MTRGVAFLGQGGVDVTFVESAGWELPAAFQSPADELALLNETVGLADLSGWGVLRLRGRDRLDFVQRMSTNDVISLTPGQGAATVFTTPIGRIIDLAFVLNRGEELLLVVGRGADETVAGWLRRHIFFNDDVLVENVTEQWGMLGCSGPAAPPLMAELFGREVTELPSFHTCARQYAGEHESAEVIVARSVPLGYDFSALVPADQTASLAAALSEAVESFDGAPVGEMALEAARVGAGWPRFGRELSEDYIPLEAGLKWAISFHKGCYVGQEVIARMETHQRLAKRLVVLGSQGGKSSGDGGFVPGDDVWASDARVGQVTSVAPLAHGEVVKALAYIKTEMAEPGRELRVSSEGGSVSAGVLTVSGTSAHR